MIEIRFVDSAPDQSPTTDLRADLDDQIRAPSHRGPPYRHAALAEETPGKLLEWRALGTDQPRSLRIELAPAPGDQGTETTLIFRFAPPGGVVGEALTKLFAVAPELMVAKALARFKALLEAGEIPTVRGNPSARREAAEAEEQK